MTDVVPRHLGDGISVITAPLPFSAPPVVNVYLLERTDGLTMIDCGVDWEPGYQSLVSGLADLGYRPESIDTLIVSHLHPDHVGMAPRLVKEWGVQLVMHQRATKRYQIYNDLAGFVTWVRKTVRLHGASPTKTEELADFGTTPMYMNPIDPPDRVVSAGDRIELGSGRALEVLYTPGHDPAHICLHDTGTGILFSGDHILPRITPVVMYDQEDEDSLGDFLGSLQAVADLKIGLTYPAHGTIVERGASRAEQIILHHHRRLNGMMEVLRLAPATAWQVMTEVFRPHLDLMGQRLALRETIAHLEYLRLRERLTTFDSEEVCWYRPL